MTLLQNLSPLLSKSFRPVFHGGQQCVPPFFFPIHNALVRTLNVSPFQRQRSAPGKLFFFPPLPLARVFLSQTFLVYFSPKTFLVNLMSFPPSPLGAPLLNRFLLRRRISSRLLTWFFFQALSHFASFSLSYSLFSFSKTERCPLCTYPAIHRSSFSLFSPPNVPPSHLSFFCLSLFPFASPIRFPPSWPKRVFSALLPSD